MAESTESELIRQRAEKIEKLATLDGRSYPNDFRISGCIADAIALGDPHDGPALEATPIRQSLAGRVMAINSFGKAAFVRIKDRSGVIQAYVRKDGVSEAAFERLKLLDVGDFVGVEGPLMRTRTNELTLKAEDFRILSKSLRPLPEKWHGLKDQEARQRQRYVDLIVNEESREVFRLRTRVIQYIRRFLDGRGYLEVETPMMHPILGGANARPFKTHHNTLDMDLYLRIAPELYLKRLVVGGFDRVYEINRNFRNEGLSTRHNPEFTMIEFYQAYATYTDLMDLTEELLRGLVTELLGKTTLEFRGQTLDFGKPFRRLSICDGLREYCGASEPVFHKIGEAAEFAIWQGVPRFEVMQVIAKHFGTDTVATMLGQPLPSTVGGLADYVATRPLPCAMFRSAMDGLAEAPEAARHCALEIDMLVFEKHVEQHLVQPTFVTDFPLSMSPLSRKKDSDPTLVDRFELYICNWEMANAFSELNDPVDQAGRFRMQLQAKAAGNDEAMEFDDDFVRALEFGLPPTAGEGIGIDRLVMMVTGQENIRDVILFPLLRPES